MIESTNNKKCGKVQNRIVWESAERIENIEVRKKCRESLERKRSRVNEKVDGKCSA